jgi:hypothetical protein
MPNIKQRIALLERPNQQPCLDCEVLVSDGQKASPCNHPRLSLAQVLKTMPVNHQEYKHANT